MFLFFVNACNSNTTIDKNAISEDSATIAKGEVSFTQYCAGCHNFKQNGIGPQLGGLTLSASKDWIKTFIRNPKEMMATKDERASQLSQQYKMIMPSFPALSDDDMEGIIAFMHSHKLPGKRKQEENGTELSNPIPSPIKSSGMEVGLELVTQIPASTTNGQLSRARITKLDFEPGSGNTFIVDLRGKLYRMVNNKPFVYMDMAKLKANFIDEPRVATGFGSFAFHPGFAKNGLLYTSHTESPGSGNSDFSYADSIKVTLQWVLTEWKAKDPAAPVFSGTSRELFRVNMVSGMHGMQEIAFNPLAKQGEEDYGMLYVCIGDGASAEEGYPFLAHSLDKVWGSILRIEPSGNNSANGQYGIPANNPFANANAHTLKEIYAYGFRNPHRITWTKTGEILACNIGQTNIESINVILPGHDYGWPDREGSFVLNPYGDLDKVYPLPPNDSVYKFTYPVAEYDHDEGNAISGGYEYWGNTIPLLKGKFLFGDIPAGRLFYIDMAAIKQGKQATIKEWTISLKGISQTLVKLCKNDRVDLHFGRDSKGELYILTKTDGKVYKLVNAAIKSSNIP